MKYTGRFKPKNISKYLGDPTKIIYRSGWELAIMLWCDKQENVVGWCSEDIVIPYLCPTDNRIHQYFVDFLIKFDNSKIVLVEVKPDIQTRPPKVKTNIKSKRPTRKYIKETFAYIKNEAKWKAANEYAIHKGWLFQIWTEKTFKELGVNING